MEAEDSGSASPFPVEHESSESPERQIVGGTGRGRRRAGRARGVGRVRGGRRGREPAPINMADEAAATREERDTQLRERISQLPEDNVRSLLFKACERDPSFALEIVNASSTMVRRGGFHPQPEDGVPSWCVCTKCREMPTDQEKVCCGQVQANCFSTLPDFNLIALDNLVLAVAQKYREGVFAAAPDDDFNKGRRHAAYRQFILWQHGYLGAGNRRIIPSCCVWKIRDRFPDVLDNIEALWGSFGVMSLIHSLISKPFQSGKRLYCCFRLQKSF